MRIAFIIPQFPTLSETFILNQITGLLDRGHEVRIFALAQGTDSKIHADVQKYELLQKTCYIGVPVSRFARCLKAIPIVCANIHRHPVALARSFIAVKEGKRMLSLWQLHHIAPFLRCGPFDIVQCHYGQVGNLGALLRRIGLVSGKIVTMFHGCDIRLGINKGPQVYSQLKDYGDLFLSICAYNRERLLEFGFDPQKIVDHPVGIDVCSFDFRWNGNHQLFGDASKQVELLTVARLVPEKGLHHAIASLKRVLEKNPSCPIRYTIVGYGPLENQLKQLVSEMRLTHCVRLAQTVSRISHFLVAQRC